MTVHPELKELQLIPADEVVALKKSAILFTVMVMPLLSINALVPREYIAFKGVPPADAEIVHREIVLLSFPVTVPPAK